MHLAVCDDHIADRKQMERLLGRESDRRIPTTGVLYVDSYGSENSILYTPMIYDALFLDMSEEGNDAVRIANELRKRGAQIPFVFCCGKTDYRKRSDLPDNSLFLDKPVHPAELSAMIDTLLSLLQKSKKKLLEFRNMTDTFYFSEEELLCAAPKGDRRMNLYFADGRCEAAETTYPNFCAAIAEYDCFVALNNKTVINMRYLSDKNISMFKVSLPGGISARLGIGEASTLRKEVQKYREAHAD